MFSYRVPDICFNPRSREGNDSVLRLPEIPLSVSIHVPAKGTTYFEERRLEHERVSIHVPAKGTTRDRTISVCWTDCFNPRSREGNDPYSSFFLPVLYAFQSTFPRRERPRKRNALLQRSVVSIHVPAKGTTCPDPYQRGEVVVSIHVPAKGTTKRARALYME